MAARIDFTVEQGSDFSQRFGLRRKHVDFVFTDYAEAKIRQDYDSDSSESFTVTTSNKYVTLSMSHNDTKDLVPGKYVYDLKVGDYLSRLQGYINNTTGDQVLYTGAELYDVTLYCLRAAVGLETVPSDKVDFFDFDNDGVVSTVDALSGVQAAGIQDQSFIDEFNGQTSYPATNIINTILTSNVSPKAVAKIRVLQGAVTVTAEVTK